VLVEPDALRRRYPEAESGGQAEPLDA
jgi:hypothetical protein